MAPSASTASSFFSTAPSYASPSQLDAPFVFDFNAPAGPTAEQLVELVDGPAAHQNIQVQCHLNHDSPGAGTPLFDNVYVAAVQDPRTGRHACVVEVIDEAREFDSLEAEFPSTKAISLTATASPQGGASTISSWLISKTSRSWYTYTETFAGDQDMISFVPSMRVRVRYINDPPSGLGSPLLGCIELQPHPHDKHTAFAEVYARHDMAERSPQVDSAEEVSVILVSREVQASG